MFGHWNGFGLGWICVGLVDLTMFTRAWDGFGWVCGFGLGFGFVWVGLCWCVVGLGWVWVGLGWTWV